MTETQSKFTKKVVWITVFIFCIRCFISGTKIITDFSIYDLYGYTGEAISIATLLMFAYEKIKKEKDTNREISTALREIRQALKVL